MDLSKADISQALPESDAGATRRTFMRTFMKGICVAIPAVGVLTSMSVGPAYAIDPCSKTYNKYNGHACTEGGGGCPSGDAGECIGSYTVYSTYTLQECGSFTDNEGPCGTATCSESTGELSPAKCG
jgi:hypothetical protein